MKKGEGCKHRHKANTVNGHPTLGPGHLVDICKCGARITWTAPNYPGGWILGRWRLPRRKRGK